MKLNKLLYGAMTALILSGCSSDDLPGQGQGNNEGNDVTSPAGYLAVKINMGSETTTRANDGDGVNFADGEEWEYNVGSAELLLFTTKNENDGEDNAVFLEDYDLKGNFQLTSPGDDTDPDNISSSGVEGVAVDNVEGDPYLWALILINKPADLTLPEKGKAFSEFKTQISDVNFLSKYGETNGIFMVNAPLSAKRGVSEDPTKTPGIQTLVKLGKASDKIKGSLQEAKSSPAACIYVERALAKVTATLNNPTISIKAADGETVIKAKVSAEFGLRNMNSQSYVVRNVKGIVWDLNATTPAYYRMIGESAMPQLYDPLHMEEQSLFRTYWAIDPNYNDGVTTGFFETAKDGYVAVDGKSAFFPKENTFDVAHMTNGNTTMALFKVTFEIDGTNSTNDLYILNEDHSKLYITQSDVTSYARAYICNQDVVKNALKESFKPGVTTVDENDDFSTLVRIGFAAPDKNKVIKANAITLENRDNTLWNKYFDESSAAKFKSALGSAVIADLLLRVNNNYEIVVFEGGVSYYQIPISHFGQKSTPWVKDPNKNQTTVSETYGPADSERDSKYLGRYGVVRNNWYELQINSFSAIGSPVVPELKPNLSNDNDEVKKYIGIETHILSWAKRFQGIDF